MPTLAITIIIIIIIPLGLHPYEETTKMKTRKRWSSTPLFLGCVLILLDLWTLCRVSCTIQISSKDSIDRRSDDVSVVAKSFTCEGKQDGVYPDVTTNCTFYHRCIKGVSLTYHCQGGSFYNARTGQCATKLTESCVEKPANSLAASCFQKADGIYVDYESDCHNYYRCESSMKIDFTCGQHMIFELRSVSCVASNMTSCHIPSCTGKTEGYYPVPDSDAKLYYSCGPSGMSSVISCPSEKRFDSALSACRTFPFTSTFHLDCSGKADGLYPDVARSCQHVYYCQSEQVKSVLSCPYGLAFDIAANRCHDAQQVKCSSVLADELFSPSCQNKIDGYYPEIASGCRSFYYCLEGKRFFNVTCPAGQLFNNQMEKCDDASNVVCSASTLSALHHFCRGKVDGFYPNPVTGCKSYIYCQEGRISSEITCPTGKVFNLTIEDCTSSTNTSVDVLCSSVLLVEDCNGKQDGYHPYYYMGCQKYFYCGAGRKLLEFQCPKGQLFHPIKKQCMNASRVTCEQNSFSPECSARTDGYYPNMLSGCRTFYYCRNGLKMNELSCPSRQIFDVRAQACADEESTTCQSLTDCSDDGFFGDYSNSCQTYHLCSDGQKVSELLCSSGTSFDSMTRACVPNSVAICVATFGLNHSDCSDKLDGFHVISSFENMNSRQFFQCQNGRMIAALQCPPKSIFDTTLGRCVIDQSSANCIGDFCCQGLPDGYYVHNESIDSVFYSCVNNHLIEHRCPGNLTFNLQTRACNEMRSGTLKVNNFEDNKCTDKDSDIYMDTSPNCSQFILCIESTLTAIGICWPGYIFNPAKGLCESWTADVNDSCSRYVTLKTPPESSKQQKLTSNIPKFLSHTASTLSPTFFEKPMTLHHKIKGMFHKELNRPTSSRSGLPAKATPRSEHFAELSSYSIFKVPTTELVTEASSTPAVSMLVNQYLLGDRDCKGKFNGVFPDFSSGCRKFFICFREVKMLYTCSRNRLFNPQTNTCDDAQDVLCQPKTFSETHGPTNDIRRFDQSVEDYENFHRPELSGTSYNDKFACLPYEMGFFPEYSSGCREFYVCFRGIQKIYTCPDGLLFSPITKSCDAPANVNCTSDQDGSAGIKSPFSIAFPNVSNTKITLGNSTTCNDSEVIVDVETQCQSYTMCQDGQMRTFTCPDTTRYNIHNQSCDPSETVSCGDISVSSTTGQLAESTVTLYRTESTVSTTTRASTLQPVSVHAPPRTPPTASVAIVNIGQSVVTESGLSPHPFDCSKRVDGFYPDYVRHCHVFYRCLRGRKLSYYCKVGQLFNPATQLCDLEENVRCL